MKLRRVITRRGMKRTGLVLCILLASAFVTSRWWYVSASAWSDPERLFRIKFAQGGIRLSEDGLPPYLHMEGNRLSTRAGTNKKQWWDLWFNWKIADLGGGMSTRWLYIPLWVPLVLIAIPTRRLVVADRHLPSRRCQKCQQAFPAERGSDSEDESVCPECDSEKRED